MARAQEQENALRVLSSFDECGDLVLYYKHLMVLKGDAEYTLHFNASDVLSDSQRHYATAQLALFETWYAEWNRSSSSALPEIVDQKVAGFVAAFFARHPLI